MGQINITFKRGGRVFSKRPFTLEEARKASFDHALLQEGVTAGMLSHEVYVREEMGDKEIPAGTRRGENLESVLRAVSEDGNIEGKRFIIDCTVEHKGANRGKNYAL